VAAVNTEVRLERTLNEVALVHCGAPPEVLHDRQADSGRSRILHGVCQIKIFTSKPEKKINNSVTQRKNYDVIPNSIINLRLQYK
jgi:hypothetical protein